VAEQPITVTVEGMAATLRALTLASYNLERYKSLYAGGPSGGSSDGFRNSLDYSLRLFETNLTRLQTQLRDLRDAVKAAGEEMIDLDTDYAHQHGDLINSLTEAARPIIPNRNLV
jgi:hypothetical protein